MRLLPALLLSLTPCAVLLPAAPPASAARSAAGAATGAAAAACVRVRENQQVRLTGKLRKDTFTETYSGGGQPQDANHKVVTTQMGSLVAEGTTCQTRSNGRWRVLSPIKLIPGYYRLSPSLEITEGRMGWGLVPRTQLARSSALRAGGLQIEATECTKGSLFSFLSAVSDLPIPGITYVVSVGQYLVGQAIPADKTRCARLVAPLDVKFRIGRDGTLAVRGVRNSTTYQAQDLGDLKIKVRMDVFVRPA